MKNFIRMISMLIGTGLMLLGGVYFILTLLAYDAGAGIIQAKLVYIFCFGLALFSWPLWKFKKEGRARKKLINLQTRMCRSSKLLPE